MAPLDSDYAKGTSETDLYDDDFTVQEAILSSLNDVISALEVEESYLDDKRRPSKTAYSYVLEYYFGPTNMK